MTSRGNRLHFLIEDETVSFYADPDMLATVIINLIDNALKYSPDDQPIRIAAREEYGSIMIEVCDRGIGIPHAELGKIGRRFFRASNVKATTGTGLGLYSARKLLAYHDGKLRLLSNAEGGMTAIVTMPSSNETPSPLLSEEMMA